MLRNPQTSGNIESHEAASSAVMNEPTRIPRNTSDKPAKRALFPPFALDLETGELHKAGARIRLQNKPFQILRALIRHPGEVVTREELRHHVWPDDTFVDFESGLNTAANRLRVALNDSADKPRYIETLPRIGYRFIAPVHYETHSAVAELQVVDPLAVHADAQLPAIRARGSGAQALLIGAVAVITTVVLAWPGRRPAAITPSFHQLTFRRGMIDSARFTPSGDVVFSASWDGQPSRLYLMNLTSPEARQLPFGPANLVSVSPSSEISFFREVVVRNAPVAELDSAALNGGAPRVVTRDVHIADRGANGETCIVRQTAGGYAVEYPPGKILYQTSGWLGRPRLSPDGSLVAIPEHPLREDDSGFVLLVDRTGRARRLSEEFATLTSVAWSPRGREVWFDAARQGINREIYAVDLSSRVRRVAAMPAALELFDISSSGTVLIGRSTPRLSMFAGDIRTLTPKDISWLDWSRIVGMSADGNDLLFDESGEGGGPQYSVYLHRRDRGTTERIGNGRGLAISQDGQWILTSGREPSSTISLISADDAKTKLISAPGFVYQAADFLGKSRDILVQVSQVSTRSRRVYLQNMDTGVLREIPTASRLARFVVSPGGTIAASFVSPTQIAIFRLPGGQRSDINTSERAFPISWIDENTLIVEGANGDKRKLDEFDIRTNKRRLLVQLPSEIKGHIGDIMLSTNLRTFAYSTLDNSINLFTVNGWS